MSRTVFIFCSLVTLLACSLGNAQTVVPDYYESVNDLKFVSALTDGTINQRPLLMSFSAHGRQFDVELETNARVDGRVRANGRSISARAYRGHLVNSGDSWVRIVINRGVPTGVIWDGRTLFAIEASPDDQSNSPILYRADDVYIPPNTLACAMHSSSAPMSGAAMLASLGEEFATSAAAVVTLNLDIGLVADFEFTQIHVDPATAMLERMNVVDGIFSEQLGVRFSVQEVDVFDDAGTDPFTDTTVASDLLTELAVYRGATPAQDATGLTHMFTGRNLDGNTVGIAYLGAICETRNPFDMQNRSFGAALTQGTLGIPTLLQSLIAAHEIGHNFGSPHDGDPDGACAATPDSTFLMAASLSNTDQFSACSIEQMQIEVNSASCLSSVAFADNVISGSSSVAMPLVDGAFDYVFTITNTGGETATATSTALSFDTDLEVLQLQPDSGTCDAPQSNPTCALGDIPGSASRTITASLRSSTEGSKTIAATVTSASDGDASNDSMTDNVTVNAAADLAIAGSSFDLTVDESQTVTTQLNNLSNSPANSVVIDATFTTSLVVSAADIDGQVCMISATTVTCTLSTMSGLSSGTLSLTVRGTSAGTQNLSVSISSQEVDPITANNAAVLVMQVTAVSSQPPPGSGGGGSPTPVQESGGGGSTGLFGLLGLILLRLRKRQLFSS